MREARNTRHLPWQQSSTARTINSDNSVIPKLTSPSAFGHFTRLLSVALLVSKGTTQNTGISTVYTSLGDGRGCYTAVADAFEF